VGDRARICKRLWSPRIDSKESIPQAYVIWRAGTSNRVVVPAHQTGNRFLGSSKGLLIRSQEQQEGIMRVELFNKKTSPKYRTDVRFWDSREKYSI
jgi:hypothetical protein